MLKVDLLRVGTIPENSVSLSRDEQSADTR